jgi:hypothetical protein
MCVCVNMCVVLVCMLQCVCLSERECVCFNVCVPVLMFGCVCLSVYV